MKQNGKAGTCRTNDILRDGVRSIVAHAHCSNCAYSGEILLWTVELSRACAKRVTLTSLSAGPPYLRNHDVEHTCLIKILKFVCETFLCGEC
jgi:hypothetical protein